jgi:hypothetical protein
MEELIKIQSKLKAPKSKYNSFGKYNYRSLEDILEAAKPLLKETKCTLVIYDDLAMMGDWHYIKSVAVLTNSQGETAMGVGFAREDPTKAGMSMSQITGSSSSYARKYALNGLFLIDDTKDADTDEYKVESDAKAKKAKKAAPATIVTSGLQAAIDECNAAKNKDELMAVWNNHADLHSDKDFMLAMSTKKKEVV